MVRRPPTGDSSAVSGSFPEAPLTPVTSAGDVSSIRPSDGRLCGNWPRRSAFVVDVDSLAFVSRWVTPGIFPRRYDTHFYLAPLVRRRCR